MNLRKDICDLTAIFGFLASIIQAWNIYNLFQLPMTIETPIFEDSELIGYSHESTGIHILIIEAIMLLIFYIFIALMALTLRTPQAIQPKQQQPRIETPEKELIKATIWIIKAVIWFFFGIAMVFINLIYLIPLSVFPSINWFYLFSAVFINLSLLWSAKKINDKITRKQYRKPKSTFEQQYEEQKRRELQDRFRDEKTKSSYFKPSIEKKPRKPLTEKQKDIIAVIIATILLILCAYIWLVKIFQIL